MSLAVIKTGGKQYLVKAGDKLKIEKIVGKVGDKVKFDVILTCEEDGSKVDVGKPVLSAKKVEAKILKQALADKVLVVKYKAKTRTRKRVGHRQPFTEIQIEKI